MYKGQKSHIISAVAKSDVQGEKKFYKIFDQKMI